MKNVHVLQENIYITSDEEINVGDYVYSIRGFVGKFGAFENSYQNECKKIILTTDPELIKDGVQAIDDDFLEWFVKNQSCEWVEVIKQELNTDYRSDWKQKFYYKLIIPKEEPKQETLEEDLKFPIIIENGMDYLNLTTKIFNNGAKWQQEQIGKSEFLQKLRATLSDAEARRLIFETFNNK